MLNYKSLMACLRVYYFFGDEVKNYNLGWVILSYTCSIGCLFSTTMLTKNLYLC